jgi:hypothetical protein
MRAALPPMPGVFPDYPAPVVRNAGAERELTMMRWGVRLHRAPAVTPSPIPQHHFAALARLAEAGKPVPSAGEQLCGACARTEP